LFDGSGYFKKP